MSGIDPPVLGHQWPSGINLAKICVCYRQVWSRNTPTGKEAQNPHVNGSTTLKLALQQNLTLVSGVRREATITMSSKGEAFRSYAAESPAEHVCAEGEIIYLKYH